MRRPIVWRMTFFSRHLISVVIVAVAVVAVAGTFLFARPAYHPHDGNTAPLPAKRPANDAAGAAGWVWPDGTPGWQAGQTIKGVNLSEVQPIEIQAAQLAAAEDVLDASKVRVVDSLRPARTGALMILAAPTIDETPVSTCLAAVLPGDATVRWRCPAANQLGASPVLMAATALDWGTHLPRPDMLFLVGVARGDVSRIVLHAPGLLAPQTIYTRGATWGQFDSGVDNTPGLVRLEIYGRRRLIETLTLNVAPGQQRIIP